MRLRNRGSFDPYAAYSPGDLFERNAKWFVVDRGGSARPVAAIADPEADRGLSGPPGESIVGPVGPAGRDGVDGAPAPLIIPAGKWRAGKTYPPSSIVTHEGSSYLATAEVWREPPGKGWQLLAAKGEDGKKIESWHTRQLVRQAPSFGAGPVTAIFDSNTSMGQVIYISGDGHVDLAQANSHPQATAVGIAIQDVVAGQMGQYVTSGTVTCEAWSLTPSRVHYLDPFTPGGLTAIYPTMSGQFVVILGVAATANTLNFRIHWMVERS